MTKIIMHGCNGKMGQVISKLVSQDPESQIVAGIDANNLLQNDYPVYMNLIECPIEADVIIDFSHYSAVQSLISQAVTKNIPIVVCTTGLTPEVIDSIKSASTKIPVLYSGNMSLGVNLIASLVKKAVSILYPANFDVEIIEKHHNQKIDAPSGTALMLANAMNEAMDQLFTYQYDRTPLKEKRIREEIGIHAVRGGTIVGEHEVIFAGKDEIIEIKHTALSKDVFAVGSINAAKFLPKQPIGLYDMQNVIDASY